MNTILPHVCEIVTYLMRYNVTSRLMMLVNLVLESCEDAAYGFIPIGGTVKQGDELCKKSIQN